MVIRSLVSVIDQIVPQKALSQERRSRSRRRDKEKKVPGPQGQGVEHGSEVWLSNKKNSLGRNIINIINYMVITWICNYIVLIVDYIRLLGS